MDINLSTLISIFNFIKKINTIEINKIKLIKNNRKKLEFNKERIKELKESGLSTFTCLRILMEDL